MDEPNLSIRPWSWLWIITCSSLLGLSYIAAQMAGLMAALAFEAVTTPGFDAEKWGASAVNNGLALSAATCASAIACIPLVRWLAGRRESAPWVFLGFRPVGWQDIVISCGAMGIFIAIIDPLNVWLERPLVPPFMLEAYATAGNRALLFLAVAIAAPVTEELAFRGFLFSALRARGVPVGVVVAATSALFAVIHTQYDRWDMGVVLLMGLLFAAARARFDSVIPSMVMHGFANTVAFVETALIARA
jgi:membrane protease YdiL (CAAX protease family)